MYIFDNESNLANDRPGKREMENAMLGVKKMNKEDNLDYARIGSRLREIRKVLEMTIQGMHEATSFSKSLISEAENGLKKPSTKYLTALLDKYNVNINYVLSGRGAKFLSPLNEEGLCDLGESSEKIEELLYHMKRVDMLKYSILSYYSKFKFENKELIEKILSQETSSSSRE